MADPKADLVKKIDGLKKQLVDQKTAGKDPRKDPTCRQLRKSLKRAQRRLSLLSPLTFEQKVVRNGKLMDLVSKRMGELTQGAKKVQANPYVHSLRKKTKSLNKQKKALDRVAKKAAARATAAAKPAAAPAAAPAEPEKK